MIIGLGGYATSGKDAVADLLVAGHGYAKTYMSKPLEAALLALDPIVDPTFGGITYRMLHGAVGYDESKKNPEVRRLLQVLGTEVGRNMFGEDVWVDLALEEIDVLRENASVAITGVRYPNELSMLRALGGLSVWIDRGLAPVNGHTSDNTLGPADFDLVIDNTGTLEDLARTVDQLCGEMPP